MSRQWALILCAMFLVVLVIDQDAHGKAMHPLGLVVAVAIVVLLVIAF